MLDVAGDVYDISKGQMVVAPNFIASTDPYSKNDAILIGWTAASPFGARLQQIYKEGSLAEQLLVPSNAIVPLPDSVTLQYSTAQLGIFGYIGISYDAILRGEFKPGHVVVVNGATGTIGSSVVLLVLSLGASRVIAVGRDIDALKSLEALDPRRVFIVPLSSSIDEDSKKIAALAAEADYPKNEGAHLFIDAIGAAMTPDPTLACLKSLKRYGIAVFVGSVFPPVPINYMEVMHKWLEIRGSWMCSLDAFGGLIRLVASGVVDLNKIKVHPFPLDQVNAAISKASTLKGLDWVIVEPNK
jgi:alcohol dehydrogenase